VKTTRSSQINTVRASSLVLRTILLGEDMRESTEAEDGERVILEALGDVRMELVLDGAPHDEAEDIENAEVRHVEGVGISQGDSDMEDAVEPRDPDTLPARTRGTLGPGTLVTKP
jgi:hypothetical protein